VARQIAFAARHVEHGCIADAFADQRFETPNEVMAQIARIAQTAVYEVQVEPYVLVIRRGAHDCLSPLRVVITQPLRLQR
jgi:hypothetical protein